MSTIVEFPLAKYKKYNINLVNIKKFTTFATDV